MNNPYEPPKSEAHISFLDGPDAHERLPSVATGQRLLLCSLVGFIVFSLLKVSLPGLLGFFLGWLALGMSIVGMVKVCRGTGMPTFATVGCVLCLFLPLVNLVVILFVNSRATKHLRAGGYSVGFLGARKSAA